MPVCREEINTAEDGPEAADREAVLWGAGLRKVFRRSGLFSRPVLTVAVRDVSIRLFAGEIFGLLGESGCGKTTLARVLIGAVPADGGAVACNLSGAPRPLRRLSAEEERAFRSHVQMMYQDADFALDPRMRGGASVAEGYGIHYPLLPSGDRMRLAARLFREMLLPVRKYVSYPGTLSGGERKRVGMARAFAALGYGVEPIGDGRPRLMIADEPTSGMDGIVQARILNFFLRCRDEWNLGFLFISHDVRVVQQIADRAAVMYAGEFVETGSREALFKRDGLQHPFSQQLMYDHTTPVLVGESLGHRQEGCPFLSECPEKDARCHDRPILEGPADHKVACWRRT